MSHLPVEDMESSDVQILPVDVWEIDDPAVCKDRVLVLVSVVSNLQSCHGRTVNSLEGVGVCSKTHPPLTFGLQA